MRIVAIPDNDIDSGYELEEVTEDQIAKALLALLAAITLDGLIADHDHFFSAEKQATFLAHQLVNGSDPSRVYELLCPVLRLKIIEDEARDGTWLVIKWKWYAGDVPEDLIPEETEGWLFYFQAVGHEEFRRVCPPADLVTIAPSGTHSCEFQFRHQGRVVRTVEDEDHDWPWALLEPKANLAIWLIFNGLLQANDGNPLTMLLRSPQPYKGIGAQIAEKLRKITEVLSLPK